MLGDEFESLRKAVKRGCRFAGLSLAQMFQDGLEGVEFDEAAERREGLDRTAGKDESRCGLVDLMPAKSDRFRTERADRAFFSLGVDGRKPLQPSLDGLLKPCRKMFRLA